MRVFLQADWRYLLMLNYAINPAVLRPYLPAGVELDDWNGATYLSVVGFLFQNTRVLGWRIPFHVNFAEVNLRFYVRRKTADGFRRGVVFIKEIVPRRAIALVARFGYNEPYVAHPMRHRIDFNEGNLADGSRVEYEWFSSGHWQGLSATVMGRPQPLLAGSEEEFITEHFWGYTALKNGQCAEYEVEHPRWEIFPVREVKFTCDVAKNYGPEFVEALTVKPRSAFLANGSAVVVKVGRKLQLSIGQK